MFSTTDCEVDVFFCFSSWRLLLLTDDVSDSEVSLTSMVRFALRRMGVGVLIDVVDFDADGPALSVWLGGGAIETGGLKCSIWVKPCLFTNALSGFVVRFGICIFNARATMLELEIHERPEEITLTSSVCFRLRFTILLPKLFLGRSFLWFTIYCSRVSTCTFLGRLTLYCPHSVSLSFQFPNFAMSDFGTRTSGLFASFVTLVVGLTFPKVLTGARTAWSPSNIFFCLRAAGSSSAIFTCTLHSLLGIGMAIPSDHIRRDSLSFISSCSSCALVFAAQMTFSISIAKHLPVSAHCVSVRYDQPGMVSSFK